MCNCNKITICTEFDPVQIAGLQVPIASIHAFATQTVPDGYLICDGSEVSRTDYADLYAALGTVWGEGDGTTTFNIPDLRGEFLRGFDADRGVDEGREFGSGQQDEFRAHSHSSGASSNTIDRLAVQGGSGASITNGVVDNVNPGTGTAGGNETRPRNVAVTYAIKASNPASA
ncbi:phage tail protein [Thalassospira lucentensis]|uniref:phage tail protein n=1 Tax=Thalassospira lucentensis TaxID=168935 RepID=UPI003AA7F42A